jgi:Skp family chaperone for outer membrane proteins
MEFRVADFETLSFHSKIYQDGLKKIDERKQEFIDKIEPIRKEMQKILLASQSGLVIDKKTDQERAQRFQTLQEEAMSIDKDAKFHLSKQKEELTKETYNHLKEIIDEYAVNNSIDIVIGKLEIVYMNEKYEITNDILEILKEKELYVEEKEEEKEEESV